MRVLRTFLTVSLTLLALRESRAQTPENVLVVVNAASPTSMEIGNYYAQKRSIPAANVVTLQIPVSESMERADFERLIENPLAAWFTRTFSQDRILYIVLTKGIPIRINGTAGQEGTVASVDSELTLLYRKLTGVPFTAPGKVNNPYFLGNTPASQRTPFSHENYDIFLVSRLDGYTAADVRGLIDRGSSPVSEGAVVLDDRVTPAGSENTWLKTAADSLRAAKHAVTYDTSATVLRDLKSVIGYYSWGSNDPAIRERQLNLGFVNGALAALFVSTDARTMNEPPSDWKVGTGDDPTTQFAGSPQSLTGDLIRSGVTGTAGHVAEPFLDAAIRPNILFPSYVSGANLIEAFYLAMPYLSWQTVVIGDPLCAPFRTTPVRPEQISKGVDPMTELPSFFSAKRIQVMMSAPGFTGVALETLKLLLLSDARSAKQDAVGFRKALEEATAQNGRLPSADLALALHYEQTAEYDKAIERYRRVLESAPNNAVVLNNLAYALAVRKGTPQEAFPLAEKAYTVSNRNPTIADTFAWILHLGGDNSRAKGLLEEASQGAPQNAEIRLHSAIVLAALGENQAAKDALMRALELDSRLASRPEVAELRSKLK